MDNQDLRPITQTPDEQFEALVKKIEETTHSMDIGRIRAAYEVARMAHSGQYRKDGSPYVTHCVAAADIAVDMGLDEDSIIAALLHDVIEDTNLVHADIARQFGDAVADIVEGVTKLTRVQYTSKEDEQMENLRKMLMAMAKDIRVILIKIADRLHNMRTMAYQSPEKQRSKSLETMEIYAPIAHRLGIQKVKWELEDLSLQYLDPAGYREIADSLRDRMPELEAFMKNMEEFESHERGNKAGDFNYDYDSEEFAAEYPMAADSYVAVTGITVSPETVYLTDKTEYQTETNVTPENATVKTVRYESGDPGYGRSL